jgi:hypothetical protein
MASLGALLKAYKVLETHKGLIGSSKYIAFGLPGHMLVCKGALRLLAKHHNQRPRKHWNFTKHHKALKTGPGRPWKAALVRLVRLGRLRGRYKSCVCPYNRSSWSPDA